MSDTVQKKEETSISNSVYSYYYSFIIGANFNVFYTIG